jgi:hypothetical protein
MIKWFVDAEMKRDGRIDEEVDGSLQGQVTRRVTNDDDAGLVASLLRTSNATFPLPRTGRSLGAIGEFLAV